LDFTNKLFPRSGLKGALGEDAEDFEELTDTVKDAVSALLSGGFSLIQDTAATTDGLSQAIGFTGLMTNMGQLMQACVVANAGLLFSGNDTTVLNSLVTGGTSVNARSQTSPNNMTNNFIQAIVALTMPTAWSANAGSSEASLVWITGQGLGGHGSSDLTTCSDSTEDTGNQYLSTFFTNSPYVEAQYVCDTATNTPYWLGWLGDSCQYDGTNKGTGAAGLDCDGGGMLQGPPGIATLDGTKYGGLTVEDLLQSSLSGFRSNGNANGWGPVDLTSSAAVGDVADNGVKAAGVFSAPFCSLNEALQNLLSVVRDHKAQSKNWPCN
jgi:hypothetical protein